MKRACILLMVIVIGLFVTGAAKAEECAGKAKQGMERFDDVVLTTALDREN